MNVPDGFVAVVKRDCPTCVMVEPVLQTMEEGGLPLTVYTQDDPTFPALGGVIDDNELEHSFRLEIETVPTLIYVSGQRERDRVIGWDRDEWQRITGLVGLGRDLPSIRPGCGSLSVGPGMPEKLALRFGKAHFASRRIEVSELEDEIEYCFERGWSDGLPLVPPTEERVYRMLNGTKRSGGEVLGLAPPIQVQCTIEKVAVNAVMAGCKPEYFPVVIAAVEAALDPVFCMHGLLATTWFSSPMVIVNGPIRKAIGMNWSGNVLGQGNRANATIGRALQLVIRNVGGGRPQEADQSTFGNPGKFTFCFAEDEDTPWNSLAEDQGFSAKRSAVTVISADGVQGCIDQRSREPESLVASLAQSMRTINHVDMVNASDAVVVIGPEHGRVFDGAGWTKLQVAEALHDRLMVPGRDLGMTSKDDNDLDTGARELPKFRPGGIRLVRAGGDAGLFSAIIPGWLMKGSLGSDPVTKEVGL